jgi:(+)-abscisic acid 8'-hydroxylase
MPEAIKSIVPNIESIAQSCLKSWEGNLITTYLEMKTVSTQKQSKNRAK